MSSGTNVWAGRAKKDSGRSGGLWESVVAMAVWRLTAEGGVITQDSGCRMALNQGDR
jgi:hypothetical protein